MEAVARAAAAARLPEDGFAPQTFESLRARDPSVGSGGALTPCAAPPVTTEQLSLAVQGAEGALAYGEPERARAELDRVADADRCAPWDPDLFTRYFVLRARLDADGAWGFARARTVSPGLAWSEDWPADRRAAFDAAAPGPQVVLTVPQPGFSLDGGPVGGETSLAAGWHRLSGPGFDGALDLVADATLVVPSKVEPDAFEALDDEAGRTLPTALLADAFGDGTRVFVANDQGVWAATAGRVDWLALERQRRSPLVPAGLATTAVGAGASIVSGILALSAFDRVNDAAAAVGTADLAHLDAAHTAYEEDAGRYRTLRMLPIPALVVTGAGLGLLGTGLAMGTRTVSGSTP